MANMKQIVPGIKNSQKIRVIVSGVGFHTTVQGALDGMCFGSQRTAVEATLYALVKDQQKAKSASEVPTGLATTVGGIQVQVDIV